MAQFVEGKDRLQSQLLRSSMYEYIAEYNPERTVDDLIDL
jgi:hypothetical protein